MVEIDNLAIPDSKGLECSVLNDMITSQDLIDVASGMLSEAMFFDENCRALYREIMKMHEERENIDLITVSQRFNKEFIIKNIMTEEATFTPMVFLSHCTSLKLISQRRRLYLSCLKGMQLATSNLSTEEELISMPAKIEEEMMRGATKTSIHSVVDVMNKWAEGLQSGTTKRVPTGFPMFDWANYGGFAQGQLIILAARPSVGKTAFMLQMARSSSAMGIPTLALSLEMTNIELVQRLMFSTHEVTPRQIADKQIDWARVEMGMDEFKNSKLYLDETPQTLDEVCSAITIAHQHGKCEIAYVDYLQLMSSNENSDSLYKQVTNMTKRLKKLAKALSIPIVVLCQLNRNSVAERREPQLHDLRDSGSIEQDADKVLMLQRKEDENGNLTPKVVMFVRKNREGKGGNFQDYFRSDETYTNFTEISKDDYERAD